VIESNNLSQVVGQLAEQLRLVVSRSNRSRHVQQRLVAPDRLLGRGVFRLWLDHGGENSTRTIGRQGVVRLGMQERAAWQSCLDAGQQSRLREVCWSTRVQSGYLPG